MKRTRSPRAPRLIALLSLLAVVPSAACPGEVAAPGELPDAYSPPPVVLPPDAAPPCLDLCDPGARECIAGSLRTCGDLDGDRCLEWGPLLDCPFGKVCADGQCVSVCEDECEPGTVRCADDGLGVQACGGEPGACQTWGPPTACDEGTTCSAGACSATCVDECAAEERACEVDGGGYRVCGDTDPDPCLEWGVLHPCAAGEVCDAGACAAVCDCEYTGGVCEPADPGSLLACACDPDCAGGAAPCGDDGHCDTWCPAGADPDCACACDYNAYCEAAGSDSTATCACDPSCEPHETACGDDGHCDVWCPAGADPDCGVDPCRERWMEVGWRYAPEMLLSGSIEAPDPDIGGAWVLLSPGASGAGAAETLVAMASENAGCVTALLVEAYGYDDSLAGDGAEIYVWNWVTGEWDTTGDETVDGVAGWHGGAILDPLPWYLLCDADPSGACHVAVKVRASTWDRTHLQRVSVSVYVGD